MDAPSGQHKKAEGGALAAIVANQVIKTKDKKCEDEHDHSKHESHKNDDAKGLAITEEVVHQQKDDQEENRNKNKNQTKQKTPK